MGAALGEEEEKMERSTARFRIIMGPSSSSIGKRRGHFAGLAVERKRRNSIRDKR